MGRRLMRLETLFRNRMKEAMASGEAAKPEEGQAPTAAEYPRFGSKQWGPQGMKWMLADLRDLQAAKKVACEDYLFFLRWFQRSFPSSFQRHREMRFPSFQEVLQHMRQGPWAPLEWGLIFQALGSFENVQAAVETLRLQVPSGDVRTRIRLISGLSRHPDYTSRRMGEELIRPFRDSPTPDSRGMALIRELVQELEANFTHQDEETHLRLLEVLCRTQLSSPLVGQLLEAVDFMKTPPDVLTRMAVCVSQYRGPILPADYQFVGNLRSYVLLVQNKDLSPTAMVCLLSALCRLQAVSTKMELPVLCSLLRRKRPFLTSHDALLILYALANRGQARKSPLVVEVCLPKMAQVYAGLKAAEVDQVILKRVSLSSAVKLVWSLLALGYAETDLYWRALNQVNLRLAQGESPDEDHWQLLTEIQAEDPRLLPGQDFPSHEDLTPNPLLADFPKESPWQLNVSIGNLRATWFNETLKRVCLLDHRSSPVSPILKRHRFKSLNPEIEVQVVTSLFLHEFFASKGWPEFIQEVLEAEIFQGVQRGFRPSATNEDNDS